MTLKSRNGQEFVPGYNEITPKEVESFVDEHPGMMGSSLESILENERKTESKGRISSGHAVPPDFSG